MRITTKGRYALRALVNLARDTSGKPKSIKIIAEEENISPEFLEQIFFRLKKTGIIHSVRGPGGGFILNRKTSEISMRDIFLAVDEGLDLTPCTACNDESTPSTCPQQDTCLLHGVWAETSDHISNFFGSMTLEVIIEKHGPKAV